MVRAITTSAFIGRTVIGTLCLRRRRSLGNLAVLNMARTIGKVSIFFIQRATCSPVRNAPLAEVDESFLD
jgi:hypothetical protein